LWIGTSVLWIDPRGKISPKDNEMLKKCEEGIGMDTIQALSPASQIFFFILLALLGFLALIILGWQIMVLRGKSMKNPDGSADDWHAQKTHYGIAFADVFLACPATISGIILVFLSPRWGFFLLGLISFWFVWANLMTTVTSLRFEKPKFSFNWWIVFPLGLLVGLAYLIWTIVHIDVLLIV
jgi:hypothetical protein